MVMVKLYHSNVQPVLRITALESEIVWTSAVIYCVILINYMNPLTYCFFVDKFTIPMNSCSKVKWDNKCEGYSVGLSAEYMVMKSWLSHCFRKNDSREIERDKDFWLPLKGKYFSTSQG